MLSKQLFLENYVFCWYTFTFLSIIDQEMSLNMEMLKAAAH